MKFIKLNQLRTSRDFGDIAYHDPGCKMYNLHHQDVAQVSDWVARTIARPCKRCHPEA